MAPSAPSSRLILGGITLVLVALIKGYIPIAMGWGWFGQGEFSMALMNALDFLTWVVAGLVIVWCTLPMIRPSMGAELVQTRTTPAPDPMPNQRTVHSNPLERAKKSEQTSILQKIFRRKQPVIPPTQTTATQTTAIEPFYPAYEREDQNPKIYNVTLTQQELDKYKQWLAARSYEIPTQQEFRRWIQAIRGLAENPPKVGTQRDPRPSARPATGPQKQTGPQAVQKPMQAPEVPQQRPREIIPMVVDQEEHHPRADQDLLTDPMDALQNIEAIGDLSPPEGEGEEEWISTDRVEDQDADLDEFSQDPGEDQDLQYADLQYVSGLEPIPQKDGKGQEIPKSTTLQTEEKFQQALRHWQQQRRGTQGRRSR